MEVEMKESAPSSFSYKEAKFYLKWVLNEEDQTHVRNFIKRHGGKEMKTLCTSVKYVVVSPIADMQNQPKQFAMFAKYLSKGLRFPLSIDQNSGSIVYDVAPLFQVVM